MVDGTRVHGLAKQSKQIPNVDYVTPHFAQRTSLPCLALAARGRMPMPWTDIGIGIAVCLVLVLGSASYWYWQDPIILGTG